MTADIGLIGKHIKTLVFVPNPCPIYTHGQGAFFWRIFWVDYRRGRESRQRSGRMCQTPDRHLPQRTGWGRVM